jgi:hypothetical protein
LFPRCWTPQHNPREHSPYDARPSIATPSADIDSMPNRSYQELPKSVLIRFHDTLVNIWISTTQPHQSSPFFQHQHSYRLQIRFVVFRGCWCLSGLW